MDLGFVSKKTSSHRFIFSGGTSEISSETLLYYKNSIRKLGGTFLDCSNEQFISSCTHVLCFSLISSVKIMGGLASGKWLVDRKYIEDSIRHNRFLPEDNYEVNYYDNVAKYCRLLKGNLYLHFCFYMESSVNYKSFKRVFVAGGAVVLTREEIIANPYYKIDYAFCDEKTYSSVKAILSNRPTVPILNLNYMRFTIFLKHDPKDVKKFLMDSSQNIRPISTSSEAKIEDYNKALEFIKKDSINSRKLQSTPRILRRTTAQRSSNIHGTILPYLRKVNSPNCQIPFGGYNHADVARSELNDTNDDIEIIGEFSSSTKNITQHCLDNSNNNLLHSSELSPSSRKISIPLENNVSPICGSKQNKNIIIENGHAPTSIIEKSIKTIINKPVQIEKCIVLSNEETVALDSEKCHKDELFGLTKRDDSVSFENNIKNTIEKPNFNVTTEFDILEVKPDKVPASNKVPQESVPKDGVPENIKNTMEASLSNCKSKSLSSPDLNANEREISDTEITAQDANKSIKSTNNEIFLRNKESLLEAGKYTIKLDFQILITTLRKFLAKLNTSHYMLLNSMITIPKVVPHIIKKDVNNVSCSVIVKTEELRPDDTILHNTIFELDNLKICSEKVGRHVLKVAKKTDKVYGEEDALVASCYLQWLQCQIQKDYYPNSKVIGDLIRLYIMEIPFERVRKRAVNIFGELISLHPPHTVSLRNYYINVFCMVFSSKLHQGHNKSWEFIRSVIEKALTKPSLNEDCDSSNELCHAFLSLIVHILEMDLIYYNDRPVTIKTLICYRVFWPTNRDNPSVVNSAVKNLLVYWMQSLDSNEILQSLLTRLVCILLEMLWKWSELCNPLLIAEWPLDSKWMSVTNEIFIKFRGLDDISPLLNFLKYVEMPWHRLLLSSLMYRVIQPSFQKASLTNIKDALRKYAHDCAIEKKSSRNSTSCTPHHTITEVLSIMFVSYVDSSGQKFCKNDICQQFKKSLKKEVLDCNSPENEDSALKTEQNSLKRKFTDDCESSLHSQSTSSKIHQIVSENISMESNGISKDLVIKMLDVFHRLPYYLKSFKGYRLKCAHIDDARLIEYLHYS